MLEGIIHSSVQPFRMLYIDFDSFFASAEQQRRPELRGRPVAVCPFISEASCVVAASREAKRLGVKTGMRVREARRLAPQLVCIRDTPAYYRAIHERAVEILEQTPCRVRVRGIDEMALVIPSYMRDEVSVCNLAASLKSQLRDAVGEVVTASIGIASNSWLAKLAASRRKPDGLMILRPDDQVDFYQGLELLDLTGINYHMRRRFYDLGIYTPLDLYGAREPFLRGHLGVNGSRWHLRMRGVEVDEGQWRMAAKKSIGHQTTLAPKPAATYGELMGVATKMVLKIGYRLRATQRQASGVAVSVSRLGLDAWSNVARHLTPVSSQADLARHAKLLLEPLRDHYEPVSRLTIVVFGLIASKQQALLEVPDSRSDALSSALDQLRHRFGPRAIMTGSGLEADIFPDRIGFGAPE